MNEFCCIKCNAPVNPARWELGYNICKRKECAYPPPTRTIIAPHKQGYMAYSPEAARELLPHLNKRANT